MITRESDDAGARFLVLKDRPGRRRPSSCSLRCAPPPSPTASGRRCASSSPTCASSVGRYKALLEEALPARKGSSGPMERSPELAGEFTAPADRALVRTTEEEAAKKRSRISTLSEAAKLEGDPAYLQAKVAILGRSSPSSRRATRSTAAIARPSSTPPPPCWARRSTKSGWTPRCRRRGGIDPPRRREARLTLDAQALAHQLIAVGEADGDSGDAKTCALPPMLDPPTDKPCGSACLPRALGAAEATLAAHERAAEVSAECVKALSAKA